MTGVRPKGGHFEAVPVMQVDGHYRYRKQHGLWRYMTGIKNEARQSQKTKGQFARLIPLALILNRLNLRR